METILHDYRRVLLVVRENTLLKIVTRISWWWGAGFGTDFGTDFGAGEEHRYSMLTVSTFLLATDMHHASLW